MPHKIPHIGKALDLSLQASCPLDLHADNRISTKGATMEVTLEKLGIMNSYIRRA